MAMAMARKALSSSPAAASLGHGAGRSSPLRPRQLPSPHLLRLHHLQQIASWASASIPPLGAFLGSRLASACESLGCPPPSSPHFTCERCESILQVGLNCSVRVRKTVSKKRRASAGIAAKSINSVIYSCHFCSFANVKPGTTKAYVKTKLTELAARDKLSELAQGLNFETPKSVQVSKRHDGKLLPCSKRLINQCPGSSDKKTKRKGWVSLKELTASTIVLSSPVSGAQRPTPALKPLEQLSAFQPKLPESLVRATAMVSKKQRQSVASAPSSEGGPWENTISVKLDVEQKPAMNSALTIGPTEDGHPDDTVPTGSHNEEKAVATTTAIALSEQLEEVERSADNGTGHHKNSVTSQHSEFVQSKNGHASNADSLDRRDGDIKADLISGDDDVPHELGVQTETTVDRADGTWIASLGLQGQEVASTAGCGTSFVQTPISHGAYDVEQEKKDTDNTVRTLYNDQQPQYIGDVATMSDCPTSKLEVLCELLSANEIVESNVKVLSRGVCNSDSDFSENQYTNNHHVNDSKVTADEPSKALLSASKLKADTLLSNGLENIVLGSPGLSSVLQDSVSSDLRMNTQDQENNKVSAYVGRDQERIRLSDAGVQCSLLESKQNTVMQTHDRLMNQEFVDQGKCLSAGVSKGSLPLEEETTQLLQHGLEHNVPFVAERQHTDSFLELRTVRRQKHERHSSHKRLVASHRSLKQQLSVIPSLREEIHHLSDQLVEVTKVVDRLTNRLAEVPCLDLNMKQGSTAKTLLESYDGKDVRPKRVLKDEEVKVNTLLEVENKLCCVKDSDSWQISSDDRLATRKRMRLKELGTAATDDRAADSSISQQLIESLPEANYVQDVQKEKEIGKGMILQNVEFGDRNSTKGSSKRTLIFRNDGKHTRRKIPVLTRFGRQWFTICKRYRQFKWRIV